MPQLDLSRCGGDGKVSCETLIDPDLPADSISLKIGDEIGDEIGWTDINAVYDRDDSTKGNTNPKSQPQPKQSRSGSHRFSGPIAPKAPIIGLPNKIHHSGYLGNSSRRLPKKRAFPKGRPPKASAAPPESDPSSPKVSCIGKVLSERERDRRRRRSPEQGGGCWAGFVGFFICGKGAGVVESVEDESFAYVESSARSSGAAAPPGLGAMKRFASRRRSWGGDVEVESEGHVAWSGTLDREEVTARRSVGSVEDAVRQREREW